MRRPLPAAELTLGGLMAGLAVVLQTGPLYWPGAGYLLAAMSSLPVAVQALYSPREALAAAAAAGALLLLINPEEALIFGLTTGPLGLAVGWLAHLRVKPLLAALLAALLLWVGMLVLATGLGLAPLGPWVPGPGAAGVYALFALGYAGLWVLGFGRLARRLFALRSGRTPDKRE